MIAENIEKSLSYLSLITNLSLSTVKIYKKVIKGKKEIVVSHKNKYHQRNYKITDAEIELVFKNYLETCQFILNRDLTNNQLSIKTYFNSEYGSFIKKKKKKILQNFSQEI